MTLLCQIAGSVRFIKEKISALHILSSYPSRSLLHLELFTEFFFSEDVSLIMLFTDQKQMLCGVSQKETGRPREPVLAGLDKLVGGQRCLCLWARDLQPSLMACRQGGYQVSSCCLHAERFQEHLVCCLWFSLAFASVSAHYSSSS